MDKSKIIVLKNGGNLSKNEKGYFKDELIKVVSYYKYLGVFFSIRQSKTKINVSGTKFGHTVFYHIYCFFTLNS
jgi:hypothetical protein